MRCPKCGYISFDNVDECLKCKKNIKKASDAVKGTTYHAAAPSFLKFTDYSDEDEGSDTVELFVDDSEEDSENIGDGDLEVLLTDNDEDADDRNEEDVFELQDDDDKSDESEDEEEDREIEIDFSKFEDKSAGEKNTLSLDDTEDEGSRDLDLPDELADISDLSPPTLSLEDEPAVALESEAPPAQVAASEELDLESLDFDLGLDDEAPPAAKQDAGDNAVLSLDDLDFPEEEPPAGGSGKEKSKDLNMDDDLDFDLDLGGISIHKDL